MNVQVCTSVLFIYIFCFVSLFESFVPFFQFESILHGLVAKVAKKQQQKEEGFYLVFKSSEKCLHCFLLGIYALCHYL